VKLLKSKVAKIAEGLVKPVPVEEKEVDMSSVVSTGSTLLDLAISGQRRRGGGIPGGILVEIFGPSGGGKTTILGEICASAQNMGGFAMIGDAERRMTKEFVEFMGIKVDKNNLKFPDSVKEVEELILDTPCTGGNVIDVTGVDSIASLVSELDRGKDGDKRGSAKAKELHARCRRAKIEIAKGSRLVVFTNQIQDVQDAAAFGPKEKTPGGHAVPFYASLRMRVGPSKEGKISKEITVGGKKVKKVLGVQSTVSITKSSIDAPYRTAEVPILFDYGIDDIRANLEYIKDMTGAKKFWAVTEEISFLDDAIHHIEENHLYSELREAIIDMWLEIEAKFKVSRQPKKR
jgi:recombination protein RecA